ncbi:helix-turn-helix transcriptional regulator [Pararhizobium mangrovi]|uniref:Helix-turn-helix domain-containing protein n=1 Tax=Pararhizobium mangrovi TaxID=2590452 RepID=A0A506U1T2_9HYPH|nr:helix-turn-helix transcriptional regulator [Pararhizobium mangrovi]TPW27720.1 helix-turn-helix domain-containing protein [Pararhizobium mangrovi]
MSDLTFAAYLRERRIRLDPEAFGIVSGRRRTSGLRREEVAQRAAISTTWYSWLEQGRGGPPSVAVVERLARAMKFTEAEREHLYLLGLGHPPQARGVSATAVAPRQQLILDAMETCPALIRTATWDVVAWNPASAVVMTDWGSVPECERNMLRQIFLNPYSRVLNRDWEKIARFVVSVFRGDLARTGSGDREQPFIETMCRESGEFERLWSDAAVAGLEDGQKRLHHPIVGDLTLDYSSFAVDGRPDLVMLVHTPAMPDDAERIRRLLAGSRS